MIENLPDLATLSDAELKSLRQQLQDDMFASLDSIGAEIEAGRLEVDEGGAKGDQLIYFVNAQQESIFAEQMRRTTTANRKKALMIIAIAIAAGLGVIALVLLKQNPV